MDNKDEDSARRLSEMQLRKLEIEIDALRRDNSSFWKRRAPFLTFLTVVIAAAGTFATISFNLDKAMTDRQKEYVLREKEVAEKWDSQFRADLLQLLNYPGSETQTAPTAVFLFQDLNRLVESWPGPAEAKAVQKAAVAPLLTKLFASNDIDLSKPHNLELDLIAMDNWDGYGEHLRGKPEENIRILYNYYMALRSLRREDPEVVERTTISEDYSESNAPPRHDSSSRKFLMLTGGYFRHVRFLEEPGAGRDGNLHRAFCWYKDATGNLDVTKARFDLDAAQVDEWWRRCPESKPKGN